MFMYLVIYRAHSGNDVHRNVKAKDFPEAINETTKFSDFSSLSQIILLNV